MQQDQRETRGRLLPWPGARVWVAGHADSVKRQVIELLDGGTKPTSGMLDAAFVTPRSADEWGYFAAKVLHRLRQPGTVWLILDATECRRTQTPTTPDTALARTGQQAVTIQSAPAPPPAFLSASESLSLTQVDTVTLDCGLYGFPFRLGTKFRPGEDCGNR